MKIRHILKSYLFFLLLVATVACIGSPGQHQEGKPHHHTHEGFRNPPGSPPRSFSWHSLWFFPTRPIAQLTYAHPPEWHVMPANEAVRDFNNAEGQNSVTWIGHMTAVIRLDSQVIVIDPWFTDYATPYPPFGPHRKMPPGIPLEKLPQIDTVVISHNHFDHFSIATLEILPNPEKITLVVPLKLGQYVEHIPFKKVIELDWYESFANAQVTFTALPAIHFSARSLTDTNETLWAGFSIHGRVSNKKVFFLEGDYGDIYQKIGADYGPFDIALIAVGAYEPHSLMLGSHCNPQTCVQVGIDLQANVLVPLHWGTTVLGSENIYESGPLFQQEAVRMGMAKENVWVMKIGETKTF